MKSIYLRGKFLIPLRNNYNLVQQMDYNVIIVWECEIKEYFDHRMKLLMFVGYIVIEYDTYKRGN